MYIVVGKQVGCSLLGDRTNLVGNVYHSLFVSEEREDCS